MNNKQRLISLLGFAPSTDSLEGAMIDFGIEASDEYTIENAIPVKKGAIAIMELLLTTADTSNPESGMSIRYDRASVLKRIALLKGEIGLVDDAMPYITSRVVW